MKVYVYNFNLMRTLWICAGLLIGMMTPIHATNITGIVNDSLGQPVDAATINLFRLPDSTFVKTELSDVDGKFEFVEIQPGSYFVRVQLLGFREFKSAAFNLADQSTPVTLPAFVLQTSGLQLDEISVVAAKPFIERRADRLIVNVESSILASGASALDVLERSPGVVVSSDDAISIRGRSGVIIMIDGKITPLAGQALANYLRNLPSGSIDRIEIITNPSAKYDAAGNAGIIDIRLRKETGLGTNGSWSVNYAQGVYPKGGVGLNLNHRSRKFNLYGSYNYNYRKGFNDLRLYRVFLEDGERTGAYDQKNYLVAPFHFNSVRAGVDYQLSAQTVVGVLFNGSLNTYRPDVQNSSRVEDGLGETISFFRTTNKGNDVWPSYALNGNLRHTFPDSKQELTVDVDFARYWNETDQLFTTRYFDATGMENLPPYLLSGDMQGNLEIRAVKADYVYPVSESFRMEVGVKSSLVSADNNLLFFDESEIGNPILDTTISNHFLYDEQINAAYCNLSQNWSKLSVQGGLRVEQTLADGLQLSDGYSFRRNYINMFPSVFLNYNFSEKYSMGVNVSRRLDRPSYQQLNPFKFFLDPSTFRAGNPFLNPQFTWAFEWNHTFLQRFTASLSFSRTTDNITEVIAPVEGLDRVTIQTHENLAEVDYIAFNSSMPIPIGKKINSQNHISLYGGRYRGDYAQTQLNNGNVVFDVRSNNTLMLGGDWSAEFNAWYHSREQYAFMNIKPRWGVGAGIQKSMFNKQGTLRLVMSDIFWTTLPSAFIRYRDYEENFVVYRETRQVSLTYTHRFGENRVAPSRRRAGGAEDEKRRAASPIG